MVSTCHLAHELRSQRRASYRDASDVARRLGVSTLRVERWEMGVELPDDDELRQLARVYLTDQGALLALARDERRLRGIE